MSKKYQISGSFKYAIEGILSAFKTEPNFRIHFIVAILSSIGAYVFKFSRSEWLVLCLTIALVLILELINTAIEKIVDIVSPNYSKNAKLIKDVSAGAVMLSAITAIIVGLILFLPRIINLFS